MTRIAYVVFVFVLAGAGRAAAQSVTLPPDGDNQRAEVSQQIGLVRVSVAYSSSDVHGPSGEDRRGQIWGKLVPYGVHDLGFAGRKGPWRAGANQNTVFSVSHAVKIEGQPLAAGKYGLHMLAGETQWTLIFSKNASSWGSFSYEQAEDALRVAVTPQKAHIASGSPTSSSIAVRTARPWRSNGRSCGCRSRSPSKTCRRSTSRAFGTSCAARRDSSGRTGTPRRATA
jgi:hypothetical protein